MKHYFYPDAVCDSAYAIDYEKLYRCGYRGIIYDIDNTLVQHGAPADERAIKLFSRLHDIGFCTMLISNNKEKRVKSFADEVNSKYIYKAGKPLRAGYIKAMKEMKTGVSETFFVGDQLFTDVWGAKRTGIRSFLVKPINPKEEIQIVLKRYPERMILFFYRRYIRKHGSDWTEYDGHDEAQNA